MLFELAAEYSSNINTFSNVKLLWKDRILSLLRAIKDVFRLPENKIRLMHHGYKDESGQKCKYKTELLYTQHSVKENNHNNVTNMCLMEDIEVRKSL